MLRHQQRNFQNVTLAARQKEHLRSFLATVLDAEPPSKKQCFGTQEFTRFLSTDVVAARSQALWLALLNQIIWILGHCWFDTQHIHTCIFLYISSDVCRCGVSTRQRPSKKDTLEREALRCDAVSWRGASKFLRVKTHIFFGEQQPENRPKSWEMLFLSRY